MGQLVAVINFYCYYCFCLVSTYVLMLTLIVAFGCCSSLLSAMFVLSCFDPNQCLQFGFSLYDSVWVIGDAW